jgi:hypothetical protein
LNGKATKQHPDPERLKEVFCEEQNAQIEATNSEVKMEQEQDLLKYIKGNPASDPEVKESKMMAT